MDTIIFQAKSQALLGHLLEKGYSKHYVSLFSYEIGRMLNYISSYGSLDGYLQNYSSVFGMKLTVARPVSSTSSKAMSSTGSCHPVATLYVRMSAATISCLKPPAPFWIPTSLPAVAGGHPQPRRGSHTRCPHTFYISISPERTCLLSRRSRCGHISMTSGAVLRCAAPPRPSSSAGSYAGRAASLAGSAMRACCR